MTTASSAPSSSNLLSLPPELLAAILRHLRKADLKRARLVCKKIERIVTSDLFQTATLYPHNDSVLQLWKLSKSTRLASYIRELTYDDLFRAALEFSPREIDSATLEAVGEREFHVREERLTVHAINPNSPPDHLDLVMSLANSFRRLPNLEKIAILEDKEGPEPGSGPLIVPGFYSRILGDTLCRFVQKGLRNPPFHEVASDTGNFATILFLCYFSATPVKVLKLVTSSLD